MKNSVTLLGQRRSDFITKFVTAMELIDAKNYIIENPENDLKALMIFFKLYINSCLYLRANDKPLSFENIDNLMQIEFNNCKNSCTLHKLLEVKNTISTKDKSLQITL